MLFIIKRKTSVTLKKPDTERVQACTWWHFTFSTILYAFAVYKATRLHTCMLS